MARQSAAQVNPLFALPCLLHHLLPHGAHLVARHWQAVFTGLLADLGPGPTPVSPATLLVNFDEDAGDHERLQALDVRRATPDEALLALMKRHASAVVLRAAADARAAHGWLVHLRQSTSWPRPIAVVLLRTLDDDAQLAALCAGADAALSGTASAALIAAQLHQLRQRAQAPSRPMLEGPGGLRLEASGMRAWVDGQPLRLKPALFRLLWCLVAEPDRVFSLASLKLAIQAEASTQADSIHAYVSRLRKALRPHRIDDCIQTVHRLGYRCVPVVGLSAAEPGRGGAARIGA